MILKYVLKNFTRRKVRTILMILALLVSTGLIITMSATVETIRQSNVDLVAQEAGRADITIEKIDTSRDLFIPAAETITTILAADDRIRAVHPRMQIPVELALGAGEIDSIWLVGLDSANDDVGTVEVREGEYGLGEGRVAVFEDTARNGGWEVGDVLNVAYAFTLPREPGQAPFSGASQRRLQRQFTVSAIIRHNGITGGGSGNGMLVDLSELQTWLNLPGQAKQLVVVVDPKIYETNNTEVAALQVRDVARSIQRQLGEDYQFSLAKVSVLTEVAQAFLAFQALINTYGLISLGVVGLLVYTLVLTNVQEQRRDMAVLRILGSQRSLLYWLVIVEVIVIGIIGVGLGIFFGQALTQYILVPLLVNVLDQEGLTLRLVPTVSATAIIPPVISAFTVLILSSLRPAWEVSRTKVMHAINPAVADNIQLEDLEQLRERRSDGKLFLAGLALLLIFALLTGFEAFEEFGGPAFEVVFVLLGFFMLVIGLTLVFFITTVPFERLVIAVMRLISPRLTYFAGRNVSRGQTRNTLISLLVLFSGVLPSFLGTTVQLQRTNTETNVKLSIGAPVKIESFGKVAPEDLEGGKQAVFITPGFIRNELPTVPGIDQTIGISYEYNTGVQDLVGLRRAGVNVVGVDGDLNRVTFKDLMEFTTGGPESLQTILTDPNTVIISEGLADYLAVELGGTIELRGEGLDHIDRVRVVGIARRIPGIPDIGRSRLAARSSSTALVSMDHFRRLVTPLDRTQPGPDDPLLKIVFATLQPGADWGDVASEINERYSKENAFWTRTVEGEVEENRGSATFFITFLLALTGISFTTAVFAVFAVIYVTIYARRIEIGMLKSMGMLRRELTGMLVVEAIAMTLGSALAGIAAGASMGYLTYYLDALTAQRPVIFAVDTIVMPAIIIMVVLASVLAAAFSARRIVRKQAVEILRMS